MEEREAPREELPEDETAPDGAAVEHDLEELLGQRDEYLDLAKRTKADFENYRRRMASELQAASARGKGELARELVDALDNLERALETAGIDPDQEDPLAKNMPRENELDGFAHGVLLVFLGLRETLTRNGIESVDPKAERFDPELHEALSTQPSNDVESGAVLEVVQKGYRQGDQLIRPARVIVCE